MRWKLHKNSLPHFVCFCKSKIMYIIRIHVAMLQMFPSPIRVCLSLIFRQSNWVSLPHRSPSYMRLLVPYTLPARWLGDVCFSRYHGNAILRSLCLLGHVFCIRLFMIRLIWCYDIILIHIWRGHNIIY